MGAALFISIRSLLDLRLGLWSIFLGHLVWSLPFSLLLVLIIATRFDHRLLEAAQDLGATSWRRFWDIEFPILRPGIIGAGIFGFLLSFNELLRSIFLRGSETTMPIYNWTMTASHPVAGADHLLAVDDHPGRHAADPRRLLLAALRQAGPQLIPRRTTKRRPCGTLATLGRFG